MNYIYDGLGNRVGTLSNGTMTKDYWYGAGTEILNEMNGDGTFSNEYVFFGGKRIARRDSSGNLFYYVADSLGTSREIVQAGQNSACYDADFFPYGGEITPYVNSCPQNYKFTGKERDDESGLDNFGARYNSSNMGRFMSPDPRDASGLAHMTDPQSWNGYSYVRNNPLNATDPTGMILQLAGDIQADESALCAIAGSDCSFLYYSAGPDGTVSVGAERPAPDAVMTQGFKEILVMIYSPHLFVFEAKILGKNHYEYEFYQPTKVTVNGAPSEAALGGVLVLGRRLGLRAALGEAGCIIAEPCGAGEATAVTAIGLGLIAAPTVIDLYRHFSKGGQEQERIRSAAREAGVDVYQLGAAIEAYKGANGIPHDATFGYRKILEIAKQLKSGDWWSGVKK